jgi:hypothetical protein
MRAQTTLLTRESLAAEPETSWQPDRDAWTKASRQLVTRLTDRNDPSALTRRLDETRRIAVHGLADDVADVNAALIAAELYAYLTEI